MKQPISAPKKPLYIQVKDTILEQIKSGNLKKGDQLLSESQFQKEFNVSRVTVRKAIDELVQEGYLVRLHGKGTYVKNQNLDLQKSLSLTQICREQGKDLHSTVVLKGIIATPKEFSELFTTPNVIRIARSRKIDGVMIMLETTYFPPALNFLLESDLEGSLYEVLQDHKIFPDHKGLNLVSISQLSNEEAKLFNVQTGMSVIHHQGSVYDEKNQLVLVSEELVRVDLPDLFKYYL